MTVKTDMSRFHLHDELTAPEKSLPVLKSIVASGGTLSKFIAVLSGAPAALRAYARMRSELRGGELPRGTRERIALAVAGYRDDSYGISQHARLAQAAGVGLDEITRARGFGSADQREAALLAYLRATVEEAGKPPVHLLEEAREIGWTDEQIIEALAHVALNEFQSLIANAAELPQDRSKPTLLPSAA